MDSSDKRKTPLYSPKPLKESCLLVICLNLDTLCEYKREYNKSTKTTTQEILKFKVGDIMLPPWIADPLLEMLDQTRVLNDKIMTLFQPHLHVKRVRIVKNGHSLRQKGLKHLHQHNIELFQGVCLENIESLSTFVQCFNPWTLAKLQLVDVMNSRMVIDCNSLKAINRNQCGNLRSLNVCNTNLTDSGLRTITRFPCKLTSLNIECTRVTDLAPLTRLKRTLKDLRLYQVPGIFKCNAVPVINELKHLEVLDISGSFCNAGKTFDIERLLQSKSLPRLKYLDISGNGNVEINHLEQFIDNHPALKFLGLLATTNCNLDNVCEHPLFTDSGSPAFKRLTISGTGNESQILNSLKRYVCREPFIEVTLHTLNVKGLRFLKEPRLDVLNMILHIMEVQVHNARLMIHILTSICYLTNPNICSVIPKSVLEDVFSRTLTVMNKFQHVPLVQHLGMFVLNSPRLDEMCLNNRLFAKLAMSCLCTIGTPYLTEQRALIFFYTRIHVMEPGDLEKFGTDESTVGRLLKIVSDHIRFDDAIPLDVLLKGLQSLFALTMAGLASCLFFHNRGGLKLCRRFLLKFLHRNYRYTNNWCDIFLPVTYVLSIIFNLCVFRTIRSELRNKKKLLPIIVELAKLSHVRLYAHAGIASGILAMLCSDGLDKPLPRGFYYNNFLNILWNTVFHLEPFVHQFSQPIYPLSMKRILSLLQRCTVSAVRLWALWYLRHLCLTGRNVYPLMVTLDLDLQRELWEIKIDALLDYRLRESADDALHLMWTLKMRHGS